MPIGYPSSIKSSKMHNSGRMKYSDTNPKIKYRSYGYRYFETEQDAQRFAKENASNVESGTYGTGFGHGIRKAHYRVKQQEPKEYNGRKVITSDLESSPFEHMTPEQSAQERLNTFYKDHDHVKINGKTYVLEK